MPPDRERWDLSAPSSQVLLTGASTPEGWAVGLALKELVLRGNLRLARERRSRLLVLRREIDVLSLERWPPAESERPLRAAMEAFPKAAVFHSRSGGVPIDVAAREVRLWHRPGGGYVQAEVLPTLQRRGYYQLIETPRGPEWQLTDTGLAKLADLRGLIATGTNDFPRWLQEDRDQAIGYLTSAGVAVLLVGNPAPWLWALLARMLAGEEVLASAIPPLVGHPFSTPAESTRSDQTTGSEGGNESHRERTEKDRPDEDRDEDDRSDGDRIDDAESGGGGGGFEGESPGETIDAGMDGDGDGDGGGDGE